MQIKKQENSWILTPESPREEDVLSLIIPLINKFCPDFIIWLNRVILSAL